VNPVVRKKTHPLAERKRGGKGGEHFRVVRHGGIWVSRWSRKKKNENSQKPIRKFPGKEKGGEMT